jgi:hypothetical protein
MYPYQLSRPAGEGDKGGEGKEARLTEPMYPYQLLKVPPARRVNRTGARLGSPREAGGT